MKDGGFHIVARHIPPQYLQAAAGLAGAGGPGAAPGAEQPAAGFRDGPCTNVFRTWSGEPLVLEPPPDASDALEDVRRRIASLIGVGLRQISLSCGAAELAGLTLGQALQGSGAEVSVTVLAASVYRSFVDTARKSKGLVERGRVEFPKPQGIDINMMPFVMGDKKSLPKRYHAYWPMIEKSVTEMEEGKIGFLTIQESAVAAGESQRRPGLHLETPGVVMRRGRVVDVRVHWGGGLNAGGQRVLGGLYTASTVRDSCRAWDMRIRDPADVVGPLGDAEHLRALLEEGTFLKESTLYWMTDCTPHESMPLAEGATRQYFRLVTSAVSVWYAKHSTPNPLGIVPDSEVTRVLTHDKFVDVAGAEEGRARDEDEVWDLTEHAFGMCTEEDIVWKSLQAGKLLGVR